jgi:hypothetical protein
MNAQNEILQKALGGIASREFPDGVTLLRQQPARTAPASWQWNRRTVVTFVLILLALATVAFAFYKLFLDPGLSGVRDAGLGSNPNQSALPTLLPATATPMGTEAAPLALSDSQTHQGVTIDLEWITLDSSRLIVGFRVSGLPNGQTLAVPEVTFDNFIAQDPRGKLLQVYNGAVTTAEFTSLQVINDPAAASGVDLTLHFPLTDAQGQVLDTFDFALQKIPVTSSQPGSGQFTHSGTIGHVTAQLDWVKITPSVIQMKLCYTLPEGAALLSEANLQIQSGTPAETHDHGAAADVLLPSADENEMKCTIAQFSQPFSDLQTPLLLTIDTIGAETGPWSFLIEPSERGPFVEDPPVTPTPLSTLNSQSASGLTANLLWVYADEKRVALEVKFDGWKDSYYMGLFNLLDNQGNQIGSGYSSTLNEDASEQLLQFDFFPGLLNADGTVDLHLEIPVFDGAQSDQALASFHFDVTDLKVYPEKTLTLDQSVTANGLTVWVKKISYTPSYSTITLCYNKPPKVAGYSDWWPGNTGMILSIGDAKARNQSGRLLSDSDLGGYTGKGTPPADLAMIDNGRCVELGFPLGTHGAESTQTATLIISQLELMRPEMVSADEIDAANLKLQSEGIQVQQQTFSGNGGGGGGFVFLKKPAGMSDAQALEKLYQALGYDCPGPWVFTFELPTDLPQQ